MFVYRNDYNIAYAGTVKRMAATEGPIDEAHLKGAHSTALAVATCHKADLSISIRHSSQNGSHDHGGGDCMCWEDACQNCGRGIYTGTAICDVCWYFEGISPIVIWLEDGKTANPGAHPSTNKEA